MKPVDIEQLNELLKNAREAAKLETVNTNQIHSATQVRSDSSSIRPPIIPTLHDSLKDNEIQESTNKNAVSDTRPEPKYQIYYKKLLGTEDIFLGDERNNLASYDCSHMVVKVHFGLHTTLNDLILSVKSDSIKVESREKKLCLYLPNAVDDEHGNAEWDGSTGMLIVTLPLKPNIFSA